METFETVLKDYVHVRAQEYYQWKDYQYTLQYAGKFRPNFFEANLRRYHFRICLRFELLHQQGRRLY